jgi:hypothetical protein
MELSFLILYNSSLSKVFDIIGNMLIGRQEEASVGGLLGLGSLTLEPASTVLGSGKVLTCYCDVYRCKEYNCFFWEGV